MGTHKKRAWVSIGIFALMALVYFAFSGEADDTPGAGGNSASADEPPTQQEDEAQCPDSWIITDSTSENNRWMAEGLQEIRDASTPEEAEDATYTWLSLVRRDPQLLSGAAAYFLDRQVDPSSLVDESGECASEEAVVLLSEIELTLADSTITPDEAPANGTNSGTDADGNVVGASSPGISGDRDAILIVLPDGTKVWIMARCGNPVVLGPAPVPPGPTDEPPPPGETTTTVLEGRKGNVPTTVAPPPTTVVSPPTTAPPVPPTAPPDTTPGGVPPTTVNTVPPDRPDSGDGATNTTNPPTTVAPPTDATLPPGGGSTPSP